MAAGWEGAQPTLSLPPTPPFQAQLALLNRAPRSAGQEPKDKYKFWETQPVAQFGEGDDSKPVRERVVRRWDGGGLPLCSTPTRPPTHHTHTQGPIDPPKSPADVRPDPLPLPPGFEWADIDVADPASRASVAALLAANYVEDDGEAFRFAYSPDFLEWALTPPGHVPAWHVGVKAAASGRLVAFITGVPATLRVGTATASGEDATATPSTQPTTLAAAEVNFLCVHKKLRSKRLAPVLIKELTRRINTANVWHAAYTAGVVLPTPIATARYWHRSLDVRKLVDTGFTCVPPRTTLARAVRLHRLPAEPATEGLSPMAAADVEGVAAVLARALARRALAPALSPADVAHALLPRPGVVHTYVARNGPEGAVSDVTSFYTLPSTVVRQTGGHTTIVAAFQYYSAAESVDDATLANDALILARDTGHDVFNALDIGGNGAWLTDLKFALGDGRLRYYLYNWRIGGGGGAGGAGCGPDSAVVWSGGKEKGRIFKLHTRRAPAPPLPPKKNTQLQFPC